MTPAINAAKKAGIHFRVKEYEHSPAAESFGLEAAEKLGLSPDQVFKTSLSPMGRNSTLEYFPSQTS